MNAILRLVQLLCAVSVLSGAFWLLLPKEKEQKAARTVLGLFFVWSVTVGAASCFKEANFQAFKVAESTHTSIVENAAELQKSALENSLLQCLQAAGFSAEKVTCEVHVLENGSINISKAVLFLKNGNDFENAVAVLQRQPGLEVLEIVKGE